VATGNRDGPKPEKHRRVNDITKEEGMKRYGLQALLKNVPIGFIGPFDSQEEAEKTMEAKGLDRSLWHVCEMEPEVALEEMFI
jgi:hypothetical protein